MLTTKSFRGIVIEELKSLNCETEKSRSPLELVIEGKSQKLFAVNEIYHIID